MRSRNDPTVNIILGISLFVFVLCSYLAWQTYKTKENLRKETLPDRKQALKNQKDDFEKKLERLREATDVLGWRYLYLDLVPAEDHKRKYLEDGLYNLRAYPSIKELRESGRFREQAKKILTEAGYSASYVEQATLNRYQTERLIRDYYEALGNQQNKTLTNLQNMAEHLNQVRRVLIDYVGDEIDLGPVSEKDTWTISKEDNKDLRAPNYLGDTEGVTLSTLLTRMNMVLNKLTNRRKSIENNIESTRKTYYTFTKQFGDQQKIDNLISTGNEEVAGLRSDIDALRDDVRSNRQQLLTNLNEEGVNVWNKQKEKNALLDRHTRVQEQQNDRKQALKQRLERLQEQQKEPVERETQDQVDGSVLTVNQDAGIGFIDIGKQDGLLQGTEFEVFETVKGGRIVEKGTIKVTDRMKKYARFKIVNQIDDLNKPIDKKDLVRSDTFDRDDRKVFVFAGQMKGPYSRSALEELIEENGHRVEPEISPRTDFVVIGRGYSGDRDYRKAMDLGIDTISQTQLKRMLGIE